LFIRKQFLGFLQRNQAHRWLHWSFFVRNRDSKSLWEYIISINEEISWKSGQRKEGKG